MESYDVIIIGGGPSGLTAGMYVARRKLRTLILEAEGEVGGQPLNFYPKKNIQNFPGFPEGITGEEFSKKLKEHALTSGVKIRTNERVVSLAFENEKKIVITEKSKYVAKSIIICIGFSRGIPKKLGIKGEEEFYKKGVEYKVKHPEKFSGKRVIVVGGGNVAVENALNIEKFASKVILIHRRDELRAEEFYKNKLKASKVEIRWNTELKEIKGNDKVEKVILYNNKTFKEEEVGVDEIIINIGVIAQLDFLKKAGLAIEKNYIKVNLNQETNIAGVFAAGDITGRAKQLATACGDAVVAALNAYKYVKKPYWA